MPTKFTLCTECNYLDWFNLDHEWNKYYKIDLEKYNALLESGFPELVAINIVKKINHVKPCAYCHHQDKTNYLCERHYKRAVDNGKHYRGINNKPMCDSCCWWEV